MSRHSQPPMNNAGYIFNSPNSSQSRFHSGTGHASGPNSLHFEVTYNPSVANSNPDHDDFLYEESYEQNLRSNLPQLNTECSGVNTNQIIPNHSTAWYLQNSPSVNEVVNPRQILPNANNSELNVDIMQPPFRIFQSSSSLSPYGTFSPSSPHNAPSSPSGSSGYQSASPYTHTQPLTPISGPNGGSQIAASPYASHPNLPENGMIITPRTYQFSNTPSPPKREQNLPPYSPNLPIGLGPLIPQDKYIPHTSSDRRRYVDDITLEEPITFELQNSSQGGISLRDALTSRFIRLVGRDDLMFINRGPSISIRLQWKGYQPWSRQIPTRDFRSPPGPITRSKLAKNVAKSVERFIEEHQGRPIEDGTWQVGPNHINVDDLILVSLHHVSMGSWQANLRLNRPLR